MTLVLTSDELRVSATIHGGRLPATLDAGWSTEDIPVADVVALRGLLARGLATAHDTDIRLTGELAAAVPRLLSARHVVEARRDGTTRPGRWLLATDRDGVLSATEHRPDLWHLASGREDLIECLLSDLPATTRSGHSVTLPTGLLAAAERQPSARLLAGRGLPAEVAEIVAAVLADLLATTTVRSWHRNGSTTECAAITWLETASTGTWLAIPREDSHTELRPVDRDELLAELRELLGGINP